MYLAYFGLSEKPFSITPDPRYLYMSEQHREAMAHLTYGVTEGGGFVQLTGEVGTGKTTICRYLLERLPEKVTVALINNPRINERQFLAAVCDELGIAYPKAHSSKLLIDKLNDYLLEKHASGARVVLIVDEAQNLSRGVLERVRLLTNLETAKKKLLQIILIGQPELVETLARPDLRQLAQRITARYSIDTLSLKDTKAYINHRLSIAGCDEPLFGNRALRLVHRKSGGVPRLINVLCDYALLGAYSKAERTVTRDTMRQAVREVFGEQHKRSKLADSWLAPLSWGAVGAAAAGITLLVITDGRSPLDWWPWAKQLGSSVASTGGASEGEADTAAESTPRADNAAVRLGSVLPNSAAVSGEMTDAKNTLAQPVNAMAPIIQPGLSTASRSATTPGKSGGKSNGFTDRLEEEAANATLVNGFAALTRLWGRPGEIDRDESLCDGAARLGLSCLRSTRGFGELERLNRTALLHLPSVDGEDRYVLLTASDGETVTINIDGVETIHSREELEAAWDGDFSILWRPPVTVPTIRPGAPAEEVVWLRKALDYVLNESSEDGDNPIYDTELSERVRKMQSEFGLQATGEVDARTLIVLNTLLYAANDGTPTLQAL